MTRNVLWALAALLLVPATLHAAEATLAASDLVFMEHTVNGGTGANGQMISI